MNSFNRGRVALAFICVIAFVALVFYLGARTPAPEPINGDQLGQHNGESFADYSERASASVEALDPASEENSYALVAFTDSLTPEEAANQLTEVERVSAMTIGVASARALPEPIAGEDRADVFQRDLDRIAYSLQGIGDVPVPERIDAVVVWDDPATLRSLYDEPYVATVEALPSDAAWGMFGIQPVNVHSEFNGVPAV
ncbi:hypothetical protein [Corynebacterium lubricantis]|uniref:hypothetical protein n=1 Tax=Corynebacterium lubricantis TaxID=541095 RepID=UPI00036E9FBD|nr:hypothetical protein [Corynebacterium lubricantis]